MSGRAVAPIVGVVLLLAVTVVAATAVGTAVTVEPPIQPTNTAFEAAADADGEVRITHLRGDPIDPETLRLRVSVDGELLDEQPPVPFFSAHGFESGPDGAFNVAFEGKWRPGETASFRIAGTNDPAVRAGSSIEVELYVGAAAIATLETTA